MVSTRFKALPPSTLNILLILYLNISSLIGAASSSPSAAVNVTNPLIYTKLRFDRNFLQIYRHYQKELTAHEVKRKIKVHEPTDENKTKESEIVYYENNNVESTSLTYDDLVFEALDRSYRTRLYQSNMHNYDNRDDLHRASDPSLVSSRRCQRDLNFLMSQLESLQRMRAKDPNTYNEVLSPELYSFFDSFASEEPGLLRGNYHWVGNWRECKRRNIFHLDKNNRSNSFQFKGRYCTASIRSPAWDAKAEERIVSLHMEDRYFKYPGQHYDYKRFFRIQLGICLPESCDSKIISTRPHDIRTLATFKLSEPLRSYQLADLFCLPDETSKLREIETSGKWLIFVAVLWSLSTIVATLADHYYGRPWDNNSCKQTRAAKLAATFVEKLIDVLSIRRNIGRLIETKSLQPSEVLIKQQFKPAEAPKLMPNDLLFLNAFKVFSMPMIIFGHVGMMFKHLDRYALDYEGFGDDCRGNFAFHYFASTPFFVDWFFVITGFLTTYLMFVTRKVERNSRLDWAYTMFHRYWRLAPIYLLTFWFVKSLFVYTGHGPNWDYGTQNMTLRAICRSESWWWPITLTSNLHSLHEECVMPAWYLACDMQFYLITPLVLIMLHKSPLLGWLVSIGAIGVCVSLRLHRYLTDERTQPLELMRPRYDLYMRNNWDLHPTYVHPQYRIATYLIGILAGHYTFMVLSGKWRSSIYPTGSETARSSRPTGGAGVGASNRLQRQQTSRYAPILRLALWLTGLSLLVLMSVATLFISEYFPQSLEEHVKYFTALIYSIHHSQAGIAMALFLVTTMLGQYKPLRRFMSLPIWTVISRLNYIVFLIQVEIISWIIQSFDQPPETSTIEVVKMTIFTCCIVYPLAAVLTVLIELPLSQFERQFIGAWLIHSSRPEAASRRQQ